MPSILFVCTGNLYRSPLAAAIFHQCLREDEKADQWKVNSAGTWTKSGQPIHHDAIKAAHKLGLNIEGHLTRIITARDIFDHDLVLVMEEGHKEAILNEFPAAHNKVYLLSEVADHIAYNIPDPAAANVDLGQVYREIYELVKKGYSAICQLALPKT